MTEEDTFRVLKRIPIEEMREKVLLAGPKGVAAALEEGCWTLEEYVSELERISEKIREIDSASPKPPKYFKPKFRSYDGFGVETKTKSPTFEQMIKVDDIK